MKRFLSLILALTLCLGIFAGCANPASPNDGGLFDGGNKEALPAVDADGRLIAHRGTPASGEAIDKVWESVASVELGKTDRVGVLTKAYAKTLWDDTNLYILVEVADKEVTEKDTVTAYIDTLWDRSREYDDTDIKHSATSASGGKYFLTDSGYAIEMSFDLADILVEDWVMGIDLRLIDCKADGGVAGILNIFDAQGLADTDTSALGEIILSGKRNADIPVNKNGLKKLADRMSNTDWSGFGGYETIPHAINKLNDTYAKENATAKEVVEAMENAHNKIYNLVDASSFPAVKDIEYQEGYPDPFIFLDGSEMKSADDWDARRKEIRDMYQYYMYGVWRDGSDEEVTYDYANGTLTVKIKRLSTGKETRFTATVMLPDKSVKAPSEAGYPVLVGMHAGISEETALANGFATVTVDWFSYGIASDDTKHTGAFYDLYPYGTEWQDQTGVLMAWGWGCSKILDALEAGAGEELGIDPTKSIVTGVSRWGKAASVAGAFEPRFTMAAPSCSGAGGLALYRYVSKGKIYDFSSKGDSSAYAYGDNEPLGSLQSSGEVGWFCNNFKQFKAAAHIPMEQYELASLVADPDRYLFIIGSCVWEDWVNAPAMWYTYLGAKEIYNTLGVGDNIKINIHHSGHAVIEEDVKYMAQYFKQKVYGIEPEDDLSCLDTSVFALEVNEDFKMKEYTKDWIHNYF